MLASRPKNQELILALTETCTASCASCPMGCGPRLHGKMDRDLANDLVIQASSLGFRRITLTGGEPLLYPDLVRDLLACARDRGIKERCVATNGFWGEWDRGRIEDTILSLRGSLTHMVFGFDSFHAEHVDADVFWKAVRSVERMPVQTVIRVADVRGERGAGPFLAGLSDEALNKDYQVYPLLPVGRAMSMARECFVEGIEVCGLGSPSRNTPFVKCDGGVYPSYHPGIPCLSMKLGDARDNSLAKILSQDAPALGKPAKAGREPWI